jgi:Ca-activated chloride channel homolog
MIEFRFAHPLALLLLALPLIWLMSTRNRLQMIPPVLRYSDIRLVYGLPAGWRVRWRRLPDALRLAAWVLLVIGLARPQSGRAQETFRGQGIDIVLAVDISSSMSALDFGAQNRLEAAKSVMADFIAKREFDRIGLVVFARSAFQQAPPTLDYGVLLRLLDEVPLVTEIPQLEDGTAIGLGLAAAGNMLRTSTAPSKVIILLTDGSNNAGEIAPITAAQAVSALGSKVYTIGMGRVDSSGSGLDEQTLQAVAAAANGLYFRAENLEGLQQIYDRIDSLERSEAVRQVFVRWQDQSFTWLAVGLFFLMIERILRHTVLQTIP